MTASRIERFIEERARGLRYDGDGGSRAAVRAGFPPASAGLEAVCLTTDPVVAARIKARAAEIDCVVSYSDLDVLRNWVLIATADPAKITKVRRLNCRHCWGEGHEYQWSPREYAEACDAAAARVDAKTGVPCPAMPPACLGGFGWVCNASPNPGCPECRGEGEKDVWIADLDTLGPAERRLVAGVKQTKDGPEVKFRDQDAAVEKLAKHFGMLIERREITGKDGAPLMPPIELPADLPALGALYTSLVAG